MSYSQWHKSNGEVMLSKWWRTPSAKAAFRRVKSEQRKRFRVLKGRKAAEALERARFNKANVIGRVRYGKVTRKTRKTKRGGKR